MQHSSVRLMTCLAADGSSPSDKAIRNERVMILADALEKLPEAQREAVLLHYLEGLPTPEIGARLGRTPASVSGLLRRGLKALRALLKAWRWTKLETGGTRPPSLQGGTLTHDVENKALVLVGGLRHEPPGPATCSDVWVFGLGARRWEKLRGNSSTQRRDHIAAYDTVTKQHYVLGGHVSSEVGNFYKEGYSNLYVARLRLRRRE